VWGLLIVVVAWVFTAIPAYVIASRRGVENAWVAFIPVLGATVAMLWSIDRSGWLCVLGVIPIVDIVFGIWLVFTMPAHHGRTRWWGLAMLVPIIGAFAYAFTLDDVRGTAQMEAAA
jgi:hypothetical protein